MKEPTYFDYYTFPVFLVARGIVVLFSGPGMLLAKVFPKLFQHWLKVPGGGQ